MLLIIPACLSAPAPTEIPTPSIDSVPPVATVTAQPEAQITVCMGQEPNSLYPFGELNSAAQTVLAAVYDGPVDTIAYEYLPVILTQLPSLENGDAQFVSMLVQAGDPVVDADGNLTTLTTGLRIRPAGCRSDDCAYSYDGSSPVDMDQMVVTFRLRLDLTWSDGTPLTAEDSVYAFELQKEAGINPYLIDRTQIYEAADEQTLQWFGIPGFVDPTFFTNIWQPAPRHAWSEFPAAQLSEVDISSRTPLGWGPFAIKEWIPGESILLEKNPYYYRIRDGFPKLDAVQFRFIPSPDLALSELIAGRCDLIDPSINLEDHVGLLQEMQAAGQAQLFVTTGMSMEWLGLGLVPASYDNGYDLRNDRQDIFGDKFTRQAIAYCLDRETVATNVLYGLTDVPTSYLPAGHPLFDSNLTAIPYDPEIGISLLEQAGWQDSDKDPATPRRAINARNVAFNTPLVLTYQTTSTAQRRQVTAIFERSLAECGIGLDVQFLSPNDLYASGPVGALFGRQFDLAQYALGVEGVEPPCSWFEGDSIPTEENGWSGTNISGFQNDEYDLACRTAQTSLREDTAYASSYRQTQIIAAEELPAMPLYSRLRIAAASPRLCGFDLDPTANLLANIEAFAVDATCQN